jgi:hypothetical protein
MTTTLTIRLPATLARELKAWTKAAKTSPSAVLRRAAAFYVRQKKPGTGLTAIQEYIDSHARRLGRLLFGGRVVKEDAAMILVDTSVIMAWFDAVHTHH